MLGRSNGPSWWNPHGFDCDSDGGMDLESLLILLMSIFWMMVSWKNVVGVFLEILCHCFIRKISSYSSLYQLTFWWRKVGNRKHPGWMAWNIAGSQLLPGLASEEMAPLPTTTFIICSWAKWFNLGANGGEEMEVTISEFAPSPVLIALHWLKNHKNKWLKQPKHLDGWKCPRVFGRTSLFETFGTMIFDSNRGLLIAPWQRLWCISDRNTGITVPHRWGESLQSWGEKARMVRDFAEAIGFPNVSLLEWQGKPGKHM